MNSGFLFAFSFRISVLFVSPVSFSIITHFGLLGVEFSFRF
jgi:hypothetical protein